MSNPLNTIQTMKWDVGGEGCKIWRRKKRKKKSTKRVSYLHTANTHAS